MKTAKEWFNLIENRILRKQCLDNLEDNKNQRSRNNEYSDLATAITCSFTFSHTPEGSMYWGDIYEKALSGNIKLKNQVKQNKNKYIKFKI